MSREPDASRLDEARAPMTAWERALRPAGASRWVLALLLVAVGVFLTLAVWTAMQDARHSSPERAAPQASAPVGGSTPDAWVSPPSAPPATAAPSTNQPRAQQISRCTSHAGSASYSDSPCPAGTFESIVTVRPDTNLADGLTSEARQASIQANAAAAQSAAQYEQHVALNGGRADTGIAAECGLLNAQVAAIDSAARQPLPAQEQDRLKAERRRLRDRQSALRCG